MTSLTTARRLFVVGLLTLLLAPTVFAGTVAAMPPTVLDKPADQLTRADLKEVVRLTFDRQFTMEQLDPFIAKLSPAQREVHKQLFFERLYQGMPATVTSSEPLSGQPQPLDAYGDCIEYGYSTECWKEPVEYCYWCRPFVRPTTWFRDQYSCDNEDDFDYVFYIPIDLQGSPHRARSWSSDGVIGTYLTHSVINGYGYSYYEIRLCAGDRAVDTTGGPEHWFNSIYGGRAP
jgi:hypothetical protein